MYSLLIIKRVIINPFNWDLGGLTFGMNILTNGISFIGQYLRLMKWGTMGIQIKKKILQMMSMRTYLRLKSMN